MMQDLEPLAVVERGGVRHVDSRALSRAMGVQHHNSLALIRTHAPQFEAFGIVLFETEKFPGRGRPVLLARLNEPQAYLLLSMSRNSAAVADMKTKLVRAFHGLLEEHRHRFTLGEALVMEQQAAAARARGSLGGSLLSEWRRVKGAHEDTIRQLEAAMQLTLPL